MAIEAWIRYLNRSKSVNPWYCSSECPGGLSSIGTINVVDEYVLNRLAAKVCVRHEASVGWASFLSCSACPEPVSIFLCESTCSKWRTTVIICGSARCECLWWNYDKVSKWNLVTICLVNWIYTWGIETSCQTSVISIIEIHASIWTTRRYTIRRPEIHEIMTS